MSSIPEPQSPARYTLAVLAATAYLTVCVAANLFTTWWGLVPIGFGLTATAGTYAAGAALLIRDVVQDTAGKRWVFVLIVAGALISVLFGSGRIAVASGVAFLLGESLDLAVYTPLRKHGWARAVTVSQIVGAVVDTLLFLWLAGFPVTGPGVTGQLVGKGYALVIVAAVLLTRAVTGRAVSREPVRAKGA
jgi:uncharacterized PurR-regulated membrane protein YhhQ (DUF165 family)